MLNKILHFSLTNRIVVLVLSGLILLGGIYALLRTEVDIFPDLNAPTVVVMTEAPGYAPEEVERMVTFPIETALNGSTGVRRVRSSSAPGFSVVWVEFDWGEDVYRARQIVSESLSTLAETFPPGVKSPVMGPQSSILGEILIIGLTSDETSQMDLRTIADRVIRPRLLSVGGVSQVAVIGGDIREYQIKLSPERMQALDVSLDEVVEATENLNANATGGVLYQYGNEYLVVGQSSTAKADDIAKAVVRSDERGVVTLADIGTLEESPKTPRLGVASVSTKPAVLLTVTKQPSVGTIELTDRLLQVVDDLAPSFPKDVQVTTDVFRQSDFIARSVGNLQTSLFEGAIFVVIVLFFFLMNLRTTLISLVALPMSILVTVIILYYLGLGINTMSLGGIAIAIGSLVDDAIVDVENVYKRLRQNRQRPVSERLPIIHVVFEASKEVRLPILNSSLIIMASFLPLFFLDGVEGKMLIPLGISFIVALIASTVVALTLTPVLCSYLLRSDKAMRATSREPWLASHLRMWYDRSLSWCLARKKTVLCGVGALFLLAVGLFFTLGRGFLPGFNEGSLTINVSTLPGISLEESDRMGRLAEQLILSEPEISVVARKTGRAELDEHSLGVNVSEIEAPYVLQDRSKTELLASLRKKLAQLPGVNVEIGQPISHRIDAMLSGTEAQIAIKLFGDDLTKLYTIGNKVKQIAQEVPGVVDVNIEQQIERPMITIRPRRDLLARQGITIDKFNRMIAVALEGEAVSQVFDGGFPYDVTLKFDDNSRDTQEKLALLPIDGVNGKIPLSSVAEILSNTGPNTINRENVKRRIVISANVEEGDMRGIVNKIREEVGEEITLPDGYYVEYGGQFESEARASRTLALTSIIALLVVFMLLYGEFKRIDQSLIILINMPLAMMGGVFILFLTHSEMNIPAVIGFISLLGIATRNGMLLMSRFNALEAEGKNLLERVSEGSSDRLLPIMMTALTSALALIPLALRGDVPGNEIQSPLALVIVGGLVSSTLLNIFVVPILYIYSNKKDK